MSERFASLRRTSCRMAPRISLSSSWRTPLFGRRRRVLDRRSVIVGQGSARPSRGGRARTRARSSEVWSARSCSGVGRRSAARGTERRDQERRRCPSDGDVPLDGRRVFVNGLHWRAVLHQVLSCLTRPDIQARSLPVSAFAEADRSLLSKPDERGCVSPLWTNARRLLSLPGSCGKPSPMLFPLYIDPGDAIELIINCHRWTLEQVRSQLVRRLKGWAAMSTLRHATIAIGHGDVIQISRCVSAAGLTIAVVLVAGCVAENILQREIRFHMRETGGIYALDLSTKRSN